MVEPGSSRQWKNGGSASPQALGPVERKLSSVLDGATSSFIGKVVTGVSRPLLSINGALKLSVFEIGDRSLRC